MKHIVGDPGNTHTHNGVNLPYFTYGIRGEDIVTILGSLAVLVAVIETAANKQDQDSLIVWRLLPRIELDNFDSMFYCRVRITVFPQLPTTLYLTLGEGFI